MHLAARSADLLAAHARDLARQHNVRVVIHACDLRAPGAIAALAAACAGVDILVNNAGEARAQLPTVSACWACTRARR